MISPLVTTAAPNSDGVSEGVRGSDFRLIDDEYVLYMSLEGDLRAAAIDLQDGRVGRSITVLPRVRTEAFTGLGQYQVTSDGTLYYVPGLHAHIGRLVRASPEGDVTPLAIDPAAFLRFDVSPDGRRLAAVVEGIEQQELRIYDLETDQSRVWVADGFLGRPLWSPDGERLLILVTESVLSPFSASVLLSARRSPRHRRTPWRGFPSSTRGPISRTP